MVTEVTVASAPTSRLEWWAHGLSVPRWSAREARTVEALGYTGYTFNDSQCLGADPYVSMMSAAAATSRLGLATSVTNPITRHPTVTAAAIASLQAETKGRVVLGIGRGDSSLAHLGLAPASVDTLERYVSTVRDLLAGEDVDFDRFPPLISGVADVSSLELSDAPTTSRLEWLRTSTPTVPITVTATGPKVIGVGARHADGLNFAVGADPARIAWAIDVARAAADGLPGALPMGFGAYLSVIAHDDVDEARSLVAGEVASFARFSAMHGAVVGPSSGDDDAVLRELHAAYDMNHHFQHGSPQSSVLPDQFIDRFAVVGDPSYCAERLIELAEAGVTRFIVSTTPGGVDRSVSAGFRARFAQEVIPLVEQHVGR